MLHSSILNLAVDKFGEEEIEEPIKIIPWRSSNDPSWNDTPELEWLLPDLFPKRSITLLAAREGSMKTWYSLTLSCQLSNAGFKVLYVDAEGPIGLLQLRKRDLGYDSEINIWSWYDDVPPPESFEDSLWIKAAQEHDLIVIDTLKRFMRGGDENDSGHISTITEAIRRLSKYNCSFLLLHHRSKGESEYRGSTELGAGVDIVLTMEKKPGELQKTLEIKSYKHRWKPDFQRLLHVSEGEKAPIIQDITHDVEIEKKETFVTTQKDIQDVISEIIKEKGQAKQSTIIDQLISRKLATSRAAAQRLLEKGEGHFWTIQRLGGTQGTLYCPLPTTQSLGSQTGEQWAMDLNPEKEVIVHDI
ncbi:MAG: AAA family ATPase [Deltaproteobacteria bacterium]|nr:MAG: AAA family ATPase [Deltaproteobacteria bacterium]